MSAEGQVYLVDDDPDFREATLELIEDAGLKVRAFPSAVRMLEELDPEWPGVILCDVQMAGMDGFGALKAVREHAARVPFVMITGHGDIRMAIAAIKAGAYDFIEKPVAPDVLLSTLKRSIAARLLYLENVRLRSRAQRRGGLKTQILGRSQPVKAVRRLLAEIAPLPITTLVLGESGTGKTLVASAIHDNGKGDGELTVMACATATEASMLATIGDLPREGTIVFRGADCFRPELVVHLVDFLQRTDRPRAVLTATQRDRMDNTLYYLASGATVELPPLRDRGKDVFVLLEHFLRDAAGRFGRPLPMIDKEMLAPMARYNWPGNVRELRAVAERLIIGLPAGLDKTSNSGEGILNYETALHGFERDLLEQALRETGGRKGDAAALLAIPRKRLYLRMKALGLLQPGQN